MVLEPRMDELESVWVRSDKFGDLLLRQVSAISVPEQRHK